MIKTCRAWSLVSLLFATAAAAPAEVRVHIDFQRGAVTADSTSLGAFNASATSYDFRGRTWAGDATLTWRFDDAALPNPLNLAQTIVFTDPSAAPTSFPFVLGGADYTLSPGTEVPLPISIAPLFDTWDLVSGSATFTPQDSVVRFTSSNVGTVAGGGTFITPSLRLARKNSDGRPGAR